VRLGRPGGLEALTKPSQAEDRHRLQPDHRAQPNLRVVAGGTLSEFQRLLHIRQHKLTTARHGRLMAARLDDLYAVTLR
jgi:hypothetical protein